MRKNLLTLGTALAMTIAMCMTSFAGWQQDNTGWWWQNADGSWPANTWQWLDGNNDGVAECYYFNSAGYMLADTTTPDGYTVNADGAWTENGMVQTQGAGTQAAAEETQTTAQVAAQYADDYSGVYIVPFYDMDGSVTSQIVTIVYDKSTNVLTTAFSGSGATQTYIYDGTVFDGCICFAHESEIEKDYVFFSAPGVYHDHWSKDEPHIPRN